MFQVVTSASYLLSDLFVPDSTLSDDWSGSESEESSDDDNIQVSKTNPCPVNSFFYVTYAMTTNTLDPDLTAPSDQVGITTEFRG